MGLRKVPERITAFLPALREFRKSRKCARPKTTKGKGLYRPVQGKARSPLKALKHGRFAKNLPAKIVRAAYPERQSEIPFRRLTARDANPRELNT